MDGAKFVSRILSNPIATARFVSTESCFGCARVGPHEDGGPIIRYNVPRGNYLRAVTILGDTNGDDICTDRNPHGDTSIRRISFDELDVEFSAQLVRN